MGTYIPKKARRADIVDQRFAASEGNFLKQTSPRELRALREKEQAQVETKMMKTSRQPTSGMNAILNHNLITP